MARHELHVSRGPDQNGERHRWTFVDEPSGSYVLHERLVDAISIAKPVEMVKATSIIEVSNFLIGEYEYRAKNKLQEILEQRSKAT